ncbi:hypothetical protein CPB85DRAFT_223980 [Mucidula mucida]|nr:hypothetical protein CPB85DRAFT_223980 [Mucidula mucida]
MIIERVFSGGTHPSDSWTCSSRSHMYHTTIRFATIHPAHRLDTIMTLDLVHNDASHSNSDKRSGVLINVEKRGGSKTHSLEGTVNAFSSPIITSFQPIQRRSSPSTLTIGKMKTRPKPQHMARRNVVAHRISRIVSLPPPSFRANVTVVRPRMSIVFPSAPTFSRHPDRFLRTSHH